jgi:hypothetical protein
MMFETWLAGYGNEVGRMPYENEDMRLSLYRWEVQRCIKETY